MLQEHFRNGCARPRAPSPHHHRGADDCARPAADGAHFAMLADAGRKVSYPLRSIAAMGRPDRAPWGGRIRRSMKPRFRIPLRWAKARFFAALRMTRGVRCTGLRCTGQRGAGDLIANGDQRSSMRTRVTISRPRPPSPSPSRPHCHRHRHPARNGCSPAGSQANRKPHGSPCVGLAKRQGPGR